MSRTSTALKRLGIAGLAAVTLGAGLPVFFATAASAQTATQIDLEPEFSSGAPNSCQTFSVTLRDASGGEASETGTITVAVSESPSSPTQEVRFCSPTGRDATTTVGGSQTATETFVGFNRFRFGLMSNTEGAAAIQVTGTSASGRTLTGDSGTVTFRNPPPATATPTATTTATPTATTSPRNTPPGCAVAQAARTRVITETISAGARGIVEVDASPNSIVELFAYTRPSTAFRKVREAEVGADGRARFDNLVPPANTRFQARESRGIGCAFGPFGQSVVMNVRTTISLLADRVGPRTYVFSGDTLPARPGGLIVSLYRVTNDGRQILTSQTRASATNGEYRIVRRFTGTGRFGFVVRTGQDLQNAPGSSRVRSLLIF